MTSFWVRFDAGNWGICFIHIPADFIEDLLCARPLSQGAGDAGTDVTDSSAAAWHG